MVVEREHSFEHLARYAAEKAFHRAAIKRRPVEGGKHAPAAASAYERQPAAIAGKKIDADRDILGVVPEAVDDLVRIAEQHAGKGAQCRAFPRFVVAVNEVKARPGAELERIAGKMAIGAQMEREDA